MHYRNQRSIALSSAIVGIVACGGNAGDTSADPALGPSAPAPASYSATVTWVPPSVNTDGSAATNLVGYRIAYGISAMNLSLSADVSDANVTSKLINGLSAGTYYFTVTALNSDGIASAPTVTVSRAFP